MHKTFNYKTLAIFLLTLIFITTLLEDTSEARRRRRRAIAPQIPSNLSFKVEDNSVIAFKDNKKVVSWYPQKTYESNPEELWKISFPSIKGKKMLFGPTKELNGKMYFGYASFVMELDLIRAQFTGRYPILGEITKLDTDEQNRLVINTFNGIRGKIWDKESTLTLTPEQLKVVSQLATVTNRTYDSLYIKRKDAENLSEEIGFIDIESLINNKYDQEKLENIKKEFLKATEADTTNPWYYIYLGLISENLDKKVYADIYYKKALDASGLVFYDYFQISTLYEYIDKKKLADDAFERGITDFLGRGYTPEQLTSVQSVLNYANWLIPSINKIKDKDVDRTLLLIERFYKISPLKEGNFNMLNGVVKYLINNGRLMEAKEWQSRVDNSRGFFFPGDYSIIMADIALNLLLASLISFVVFFLIFFLRDISLFLEDKKHNNTDFTEFFKRRYISKYTILSFVLLYLFTLGALGVAGNTISVISKMVKEPPTINSGTWGNYATIKHFTKELGNVPEKNLFLAIAYQQLKDYSTAEKLYKSMSSPKANNNLAILYMRSGKKQEALDELNKALSKDKYMIEARYNRSLLDPEKKLETRNPKVEMYKTYAPNSLMIALPSEKAYRNAFYSGIKIQDFNPINILLFRKFLGGSNNPIIQASSWIVPLFAIITLFMLFMPSLVFIPQTRVNTSNQNYLRRFVGMFIPGFSYNWKLLGPLVFAIWLGMGITVLFYFGLSLESVKPTLGLLSTYSLPDYSKLSPVASFELPFSKEIGVICAFLFVMIWLYNFFFVLVSKRYVNN